MEQQDQKNNKYHSLSLIAEYSSESDSDYTETPPVENLATEESEDGGELSEMVMKNNIINACAHGPLLNSNSRDDEETTRHMIIDSSESGVVEYEVTEYRDIDSDSESSSSSDSSDSDVESVKDVEELSSSDENETGQRGSKPEVVKVPGELGLDELPPIEDLAISLPAQETTKIGTIASIVDRLVVVKAYPETPAVDLDSVLFLDNGSKALGKVFDVFGPVIEPHYCVRFNSSDHVQERGIEIGMEVYIAPKTQHTKFVFLSELMKIKGSDASWLNDVEPPAHLVDYSDDEEERRAKKQQKQQKTTDHDSETSEEPERNQPRKTLEARRRPTESSSRFGSGPSRGRNPFTANSGRRNPNVFPRNVRPWCSIGQAPMPVFPPAPLFPNFRFGGGPQMGGLMPPYQRNNPVFRANYCMPGPPPQWLMDDGPPPPPGT